MARNKKIKASDHAWCAIAHASSRASQKARFIKSLQFSDFQPIVKQIVVIIFMKFYVCIFGYTILNCQRKCVADAY